MSYEVCNWKTHDGDGFSAIEAHTRLLLQRFDGEKPRDCRFGAYIIYEVARHRRRAQRPPSGRIAVGAVGKRRSMAQARRSVEEAVPSSVLSGWPTVA